MKKRKYHMYSEYEHAKNYRFNFLRNHGPHEYLDASVRRPGIRIERYTRSGYERTQYIVVVVDDMDRKRIAFDQGSRVEGYLGSKASLWWFEEYCRRYNVKGVDVDRALRKLWSME